MLLPRIPHETNQSSYRYGEAKALPPRIASEWFKLRFLNFLGLKGMLFRKTIVSSAPSGLKLGVPNFTTTYFQMAQLEDVSIDDQKTSLSLGFASFGEG